MLFTISAISAADSNTTAVSAVNESVKVSSIDIAGDNNLAKSNGDVEILGEPDDGSFAALNTKISGATVESTVYLENDYKYSDSDSGTGGISIEKSLTIDGQGHIIDANGKSRIFKCAIYGDVDVTLKNIIFVNGVADYGGAVYWYPDGGNTDIINCTFINNTASGSSGGASLLGYKGVSNVINCTFINNHDPKCAVYLSSTNVFNSIFINNTNNVISGNNVVANNNWFGISADDDYTIKPKVDTGVITDTWYVLNITTNGANNLATVTLNNLYDGTSISQSNTYALPSIKFNVSGNGATIRKDNIAIDDAGMASFGYTVNDAIATLTLGINGIEFNKQVVNLADDGSINTLNTKINDAIANGENEVKLYNDYVYGDSEELVKNTIYNTNNGIGIATDFTVDGQGFTIDGNNKCGRIIYFRDSTKNLVLKNINFVNCNDGYGSALYVTCKNLEIINCTFADGTATGNPGAGIYANIYENYLIKNCTFTNNQLTAAKNGGAIALYTNSGTTGDIINCSFIDNQAGNYGGAIFINSNGGVGGDAGNISACIFKGNVANGGSSLYLYTPGTYTLNDSVMLDEGNIILSRFSFNIDNNWWGNTVDDYDNFNDNVIDIYNNPFSPNKWLYLDVVGDDENAIATVSLNKLNDRIVYENYALPKVALDVQATNANINESTLVLDENGQASLNYEMTAKTGTLTVGYGNIHVTKEIKLFIQDSFTSLKNQIEESVETTFSLNQNYTFNSVFDDQLNGIEITKSISIDGNGYTIDAKGLSNIFYFDDDSGSKSLTLKNIIFTNAVTVNNGAAIYFKGNKIEIINCTFINNSANQGDAIYIADATSDENKITGSIFINNTGANSVVHVNFEDNHAELNLINSIFIGNDAEFDVKGTSNTIVDYNWWGTVAEDYKTNSPKVDGATLNNWLVLNLTADINTNIATVSLNNLYDGNNLRVYENYALPKLTFNIGGTNVTVQKSTVTLDDAGNATTAFKLLKPDAILTASYGNIETNAEIHYIVVDDGSFKALNDIIRFSSENDVIELNQNYTYLDTDTITPGIQITKTITLDGKGNTIDAKGKSGIFLINSPNIVFKNIIFKDGISQTGGAIYASNNADYLTVDNCTFINNTATNTDGGAIWSGSYNFGSVVGSTFINNTAVEDGAAIFTYSFYTDALIDKCLFINNSAPYTVIYAYYRFDCHDSIFLNNTGSKLIDGIYASYGTVGNNWYGNTFDDYETQNVQMAVSSYKWLYLNIKFYEGYAVVSLNNLYTKSSGSSSVYSNYNLPKITLNINSTTLDLKNNDKITLDSTGNAIVPYEVIGETGALTVSYADISLTKDWILPEFDSIQGLIDNADENSVIELSQNYIYNVADETTNGIIINKNITIDGKGHTIDANQMTRIFNVQALNVTFKNLVFANGKSNLKYDDGGNHGGAIYLKLDNNEAVNFNVINCTFVNNVADLDNYDIKYSGGAIYVKSNDGDYNVEDCTFINNTAKEKGGAIYFNTKNAEITLFNSTFIGNKANHDGALYIETDSTDTTIDKCLFRENEVFSTSSYSSNGNAIIWKSTNDSGNSVLKNSIILDNGYNKANTRYTFLLISGTVNIDNNWWGTTAQNHPETLDYNFINGITPNSWLFIKSDVSPNRIKYNETATIKYVLYLHDGTQISEFDNTKLPYVDLNVECDKGTLDKNNVSLNEEFTYRATDSGNALIDIYCNNIPYETTIYGPYIAPKVDVPFIMYANQNNININKLIKTANGYYSHVTVTCNDSSLIGVNDQYISAHTKEGTAKLTFSYDGYYGGYPAEDFDMDVKVVKVPLNITVTNLESNEITLNVSDTFDLDIAFEIDEIHKGYAPAWMVMDVKYNSTVISFSHDDGVKPDNGSYYPTGHIRAKVGGTTNLTISCTSSKFSFENYTIKITVNKIPTEITVDGEDSFKVDDTHNIGANFSINGTQSTATLTYESSNENVINFTSDVGDFKAVGEGTAVLTVRFAGNMTHEGSSKTLTVTVSKWNTSTAVTSDKEVSLKIKDTSNVEANLTAEDKAVLNGFTYSSSNESVATVDENGVITAKGEGTAVITVKYEGNYKYVESNDTVTVVVSKIDSTITVNSINPLEISVFDESQIEAILNHEGTLTYTSSNESVATVSSTGLITAKAGGKTNITISYAGNETYAEASVVNVTVTVKKLPTVIAVNSTFDIDVDASKSLGATSGHGRTLHYESLNPEIVSVNDAGEITGIIGGTGLINISFNEDGQYMANSTTVTVTVNKLTSEITANPIEINVFDSQLINPTIVGDGAVSYVSCDSSIATVNATNGNITAIKGGKTNITIRLAESDRYLSNEVNVTVNVNKLPTLITVNPAIAVDVDANSTIGASANHGRTLRYVSNDESIVTVDSSGVVKGIIGGTANVTVIFDEDDQYLSNSTNVTVTVNKLVPTINVADIEVSVNETKAIGGEIVTDGDVSYISTNPNIIEVENGNVTGIIGGKANITISLTETNRYLAKKVNVTVTVNKLPSIFNSTPMTLAVGNNATINSTLNHDGKVRYEFDPTKLNVTDDGLVTALAGGVHTIDVIFDGNEKYLKNSTTVSVTVSRLPTEYDGEPINLTVFGESDIENIFAGYNRTNSMYHSSNETVFTVDENGLINALAGGSAILTITLAQTEIYRGGVINITVNVKKLPSVIRVDNSVSVDVDASKSLGATVDHNRQLIYVSENPEIVSVNETTGVINGIVGGSTFVEIIFKEDGQYLGCSTKVHVTVNKLPSKIKIDSPTSISMFVGDNSTIIASTDNPEGLYYTTQSSIISILDGNVTAVSEGTAEIVVAAFETDKYLANKTTITVTVSKIPTEIIVSGDEIEMDVGDNLIINAGLNHPEAGSLTYTSSNPDVVTVDENGKLTGISSGKANITVSFVGNNKYLKSEDKNISVKVNKLQTVIEVNRTISIDVDGEILINATINHDGADKLKYSTTDSSVVIVDDNGKITAVGVGKTNITISYEESGKYIGDEVNVTVTVNKIASHIEVINAVAIDVNGNVNINASVDNGRKLRYVSADNNTVTVDDLGNVTGIAGGVAKVTVIFDEDDKYLKDEVNVTVTVNKLQSNLTVENSELTVDVDGNVLINASTNSDAVITYLSLDTSIAAVVGNNVAGVKGGVVKIIVGVAETDKFLANETAVTVTVNKLTPEISIENDEFTAGEPSNITIDLPDGAKGNVIIKINGTEYSIVLPNDKLELVLTKPGEYLVSANYGGDDRYLNNSATKKIAVSDKMETVINITVPQTVNAGDDITLEINSTGDGKYEVFVNDSPWNNSTIANISAGSYLIKVVSPETPTHKAQTATKLLEVAKKQSEIKIILPKELNLGKYNEIMINSTRPVSVIYIDGKACDVVDGSASFLLTAGTHTVVASLNETYEFTSARDNVTFTVDKKPVDLTINVSKSGVYVGESIVIYIELDAYDITGTVLVNVNGTVYSVVLPVNYLEVVLDKAGNYTINATYAGDESHSPAESNVVTAEARQKEDSPIVIQIPEVNYAKEDIEINVTCNAPEVFIDGKKQICDNGKVIVSDLLAGTHVIEVRTPETPTSKANSTTQSFTVSKKQSSIEIMGIDGDKIVDKNLKLNIKHVGNAVEVYLDGEVLSDYELFRTTAGTHKITASVVEDDEYTSSSTNYTFEIAKQDIKIDVSGISTIVGQKSTITVETTPDVKGIVVVNVNGTEYSLNMSKSNSLDIVLNEAGTYNISATYVGDDRFNSANATNTLVIYDKKEADIEIILPQDDVYAGDDVVVDVIYLGDAELTATVDGVLAEIENGQITIRNISAGPHTIEVVSPETKQYKKFTAVEVFEVMKNSSEITITLPQNIRAGEDVSIEVSSYYGANIVVYLDGVKQTLTDGAFTFKAAAGNHTVMAVVDETDYYIASNTTKAFTVSKLNATLEVNGKDIVEGQATTITLTTDLAEGIVIVNVNDTEIVIDLSKTKSASVVLERPGDYVLSARYLGNDIYNAAEASNSTIKVAEKVTPEVDVTIPEIRAGENATISISIPNATGNVTVSVDGVETVVPLDENGNANYTINNMPGGNHTVAVIYPGDETHDAKVVEQTLSIPKENIDANITVPSEVKAGENLEVLIDLPDATGNVTVSVDGVETVVPLDENGKANFTVGDLDIGNHVVTVTYPGDDKYDSVTKTVALNIPKVEIPNNETSIDVVIPEKSKSPEITVSLPDDATGNVTVIVGNETYSVPVENGTAKITVPDLDLGDYEVAIKYSGDNRYAPITKTQAISIPKEEIPVNETSVDINPDGKKSVVNVKLPDDAKGNVTVYVDGVEYASDVINGSANVTVPGLSSGNHTVVVTYSGDDKYAPFANVSTLNVPKVDVPENKTSIDVNIPIGSKVPEVKVKLPGDATGYVLVDVNNYTYHVPVEKGISVIDVPGLAYGKHSAAIIYSGDEKYNPMTKNITFNVPKPKVKAKNVVIRFTNKGPYRVRVLVDGQAVVGQYVTIKFNGKTYKRLTNDKGYVLFKLPVVKPGTYKVTAKYSDISLSKKIKISNVIVVNTKKIKKSAKKVKIKVTLKTVKNKYLKSKKLTLKINGKNLKAKTNKKGVALFSLKKSIVKSLKVGKIYQIKVSFGKDVVIKKIKIVR